jgi:hypothetical protein
MDGWALEVVKFAPSLEVLQYVGDKKYRRCLRWTLYEHLKEQYSSYNLSYNLNLLTFFERTDLIISYKKPKKVPQSVTLVFHSNHFLGKTPYCGSGYEL